MIGVMASRTRCRQGAASFVRCVSTDGVAGQILGYGYSKIPTTSEY